MAFEIGPVGKAALAGNGALGVFEGELGLEKRASEEMASSGRVVVAATRPEGQRPYGP